MYGTVARISVVDGKRDDLIALGTDLMSGEKPDGFEAGYMVKLDNDPNGLLLVAIFSDKGAYLKNADDPSTDADFRKMRALMAADPEWNDGEFVPA